MFERGLLNLFSLCKPYNMLFPFYHYETKRTTPHMRSFVTVWATFDPHPGSGGGWGLGHTLGIVPRGGSAKRHISDALSWNICRTSVKISELGHLRSIRQARLSSLIYIA